MMLKPLLITASLICASFVSGFAPAASASGTQAESNIGFAHSTKSLSPGTLNATWMYGTKYRGSGIATGGPKEGFVGKYHVRYYYESGEFSDEYDLLIEKSGDVYKASWMTNGKLSAVGVGMVVENGLSVGWRRVDD
jgi:hypothetical protein